MRTNVFLRLRRLRELRQLNAPRWIIRTEQVALLLNAKGFKHYGIGQRPSKRQHELYTKFVLPHMGASNDDH